jgi:hypothetical protein
MSALWYVKLSDGDVAPLTLEGLDEAFQAGSIDHDTMVLAAGSMQWARLGDLAGLDAPQAHNRAAAPAAIPNTLRPVSVDLGMLEVTDEDLKPTGGKKWLFAVALVASVFGAAAFEARRAGVVSVGPSVASVGHVIKTFALATIGHPASSPAAAPAPSPVSAAAAPSPVNAPTETAAARAPAAASPTAVTAALGAGVAVAYNALTDLSNRIRPAEKVAATPKPERVGKAHPKVRAASSMPASSSKSKSQGFTTDGNKFDPLNATIP